jgi:hypothetical protein
VTNIVSSKIFSTLFLTLILNIIFNILNIYPPMGALCGRKLGVAACTSCSPVLMVICCRDCIVFVEFFLCFEAVFELKSILNWKKIN